VVGPDLLGDRLEPLPLHLARVRGVAGDDDIGFELAGLLGHPLVVDVPRLGVDLVLLDVVHLPGEVHVVAVAQVPPVGQVEREDLVAGLQHREVDAHVGLRAGVGLDVDVLCAPQLRRAVDGELLDGVDVLAAAVVPAPGVALRVLVREHGPLGLQDGRGDVVLGGDHRERVALSLHLGVEGVGHLRVDLADGLVIHIAHSGIPPNQSTRLRQRTGPLEPSAVTGRPARTGS
jgi:hypothetical protein